MGNNAAKADGQDSQQAHPPASQKRGKHPSRKRNFGKLTAAAAAFAIATTFTPAAQAKDASSLSTSRNAVKGYVEKAKAEAGRAVTEKLKEVLRYGEVVSMRACIDSSSEDPPVFADMSDKTGRNLPDKGWKMEFEAYEHALTAMRSKLKSMSREASPSESSELQRRSQVFLTAIMLRLYVLYSSDALAELDDIWMDKKSDYRTLLKFAGEWNVTPSQLRDIWGQFSMVEEAPSSQPSPGQSSAKEQSAK